MNSKETLSIAVNGHCNIADITDPNQPVVLLDKHNAIHPANIARLFARGLSNEPNSNIYRIAFGNGGTIVDEAFTITYKTPNDGQSPDVNTWDSRLYNETFSKIVDAGRLTLNPLLGIDPGSADVNTGIRVGGGSYPEGDPASVPHISGPGVRSIETGLNSSVVITVVLNENEPKGQLSTSPSGTEFTESSFMFDEIGLYSAGLPAIDTNGYQHVDVSTKKSTSDTGLTPNTDYELYIKVDGGTTVQIQFTTPNAGSGGSGEILYGDLCEALNTGSVAWGLSGTSPLPNGSKVFITDDSNGAFPSIANKETYGYLTFVSNTTGLSSSIDLTQAEPQTEAVFNLLQAINPPNQGIPLPAVDGGTAGVKNSPIDYSLERERLLAMLTFSPILKTADRKFLITYTITISVDRTPTPA